MASSSYTTPLRTRLRVLRILHPFPSLLVTALTAALAAYAADADDRWSLAAWLGVTMLCYQFAIGITNDISDIDLDREHKPWKPLASGAIERRTAAVLAAGFLFVGLLISSPLPVLAWLIGILGVFCGLVYNAALKRTVLSWLPYAIAIPLIPVWAFVAAGEWDAMLWWVFPLGILVGLSLHFANQAPDVDAERATTHGAAHRMGARTAIRLAFALFGLACSLAVIVVLVHRPGMALLMALAAFATAIAALRAPRVLGRDGMFVVLAAGSALLGLLFVVAI
jgi:4-hydroxybenzoate polyprenyltransferase